MEITLRVEDAEKQDVKELNLEIHNKDILLIQVPRGFLNQRETSVLMMKLKRYLESDSKIIVLPKEFNLTVLKFKEET